MKDQSTNNQPESIFFLSGVMNTNAIVNGKK